MIFISLISNENNILKTVNKHKKRFVVIFMLTVVYHSGITFASEKLQNFAQGTLYADASLTFSSYYYDREAYYIPPWSSYFPPDILDYSHNRIGIDLNPGLRVNFSNFYVEASLTNLFNGWMLKESFNNTCTFWRARLGVSNIWENDGFDIGSSYIRDWSNDKDIYTFAVSITYEHKYGPIFWGTTLSYGLHSVGVSRNTSVWVSGQERIVVRDKIYPRDQRLLLSFRVSGPRENFRPYLEFSGSTKIKTDREITSPQFLALITVGVQLSSRKNQPILFGNDRMFYPKGTISDKYY